MAPPKKDATCRKTTGRGVRGGLARRVTGSVGGWLGGRIGLTMWNMVKKIGKVKPTRSEKTSLLKKLRPMFRDSHVTSTTAAAIEGCCQPEKRHVRGKKHMRHKRAGQGGAALTTRHLQSSLQEEGSSGVFAIVVRPHAARPRRPRVFFRPDPDLARIPMFARGGQFFWRED
eukprot:scaffold44631_cov66-Phaeocystis_antarctica.AAC.4